jgi:putative membrane protein
MKKEEDQTDLKKAGPTDHLANERTFLAWIRTSIALIGFGFVIVKFSMFVRQMSLMTGTPMVTGQGYSGVIGMLMVVFGAAITLLSYIRYRNIEKQLNRNKFFASRNLAVMVTIGIVVVSLVIIFYMLRGIF